MSDCKSMIVNKQTGEIVGHVRSQKRHESLLPLILLSVFLIAAAAFAWREHDRARKAVGIAHSYQELYSAAEESVGVGIAKQETLFSALERAQAFGYQPDYTEKYLMLSADAAKGEQTERGKKSVELATLLAAIE